MFDGKDTINFVRFDKDGSVNVLPLTQTDTTAPTVNHQRVVPPQSTVPSAQIWTALRCSVSAAYSKRRQSVGFGAAILSAAAAMDGVGCAAHAETGKVGAGHRRQPHCSLWRRFQSHGSAAVASVARL